MDYIFLQMSDALAKHYKDPPKTPSVQFPTLQNSLYITPFVCILGGGFFLATALCIEKDRKDTERLTKGEENLDL